MTFGYDPINRTRWTIFCSEMPDARRAPARRAPCAAGAVGSRAAGGAEVRL